MVNVSFSCLILIFFKKIYAQVIIVDQTHGIELEGECLLMGHFLFPLLWSPDDTITANTI